MTSSENHYRIPLSAKMVMVVQFLIILFFGYWMYEEYQYNMFFQQYVNGFINGNELVLIAIFGAVGFVGTGLGMYVRGHGRSHSLELSVGSDNGSGSTHEGSMTGGKLDSHTEQHLIDMIRKTVPSSSSGSSSATASGQSLPTLPRAEDKKP